MACIARTLSSSRAALTSPRSPPSSLVALRSPCRRLPLAARPKRAVIRHATEAEDFDAVLMKYAEKWEKTENKPVVVAWIAAAFTALFTAEWLIHLPALDVLLGFPVQLVGLFAIPYLGVRWAMEGVKPGDDVDKYTTTIVEKLPGLKD